MPEPPPTRLRGNEPAPAVADQDEEVIAPGRDRVLYQPAPALVAAAGADVTFQRPLRRQRARLHLHAHQNARRTRRCRSECGLCRSGIVDRGTLRREPVHRGQLTDVALLPRREHARNIRSRSDGIGRSSRTSRRGGADHHRRSAPRSRLASPSGPDRTGHRRRVALRYHRAALEVTQRYGGPIYGAYRGRRPRRRSRHLRRRPLSRRRPGRSFSTSSRLPARRARADRPRAADLRRPGPRPSARRSTSSSGFSPSIPPHQRGGVGRALLARVFEDARGARLPRHGQPGQRPLLRERGLRGDRPRPPCRAARPCGSMKRP